MPRANKLPVLSEREIDAMSASAREASDFLKALAHESRLHILCKLIDGEKHVSELEEALDIRQSTVSQQLARLRLEGLVTFRRDGKQVYYSIADDDVRKIIKVLFEIFCKRWSDRVVQASTGGSRKRLVRTASSAVVGIVGLLNARARDASIR